jgi:molybdopterin-guanine dinucleotide biosynthesis protein A
MGRINKAMVEIGGATVFDRIHDTLAETCEHFIVIANDKAPYEERELPVYSDIIPDSGSLGGLFTAVMSAPSERVFVCACDMPFIDPQLLRALHSQLGDYDAIVPSDGHGLQPMHAIYSRRVAGELERRIRGGELKIEHFIGAINARILSPEETEGCGSSSSAFFNVNTPADLESARDLERSVA